jgi:hypothetical protein
MYVFFFTELIYVSTHPSFNSESGSLEQSQVRDDTSYGYCKVCVLVVEQFKRNFGWSQPRGQTNLNVCNDEFNRHDSKTYGLCHMVLAALM